MEKNNAQGFLQGSGIGRMTHINEKHDKKRIVENYAKRVMGTGKFPGTHTLGAEFITYDPYDGSSK